MNRTTIVAASVLLIAGLLTSCASPSGSPTAAAPPVTVTATATATKTPPPVTKTVTPPTVTETETATAAAPSDCADALDRADKLFTMYADITSKYNDVVFKLKDAAQYQDVADVEAATALLEEISAMAKDGMPSVREFKEKEATCVAG
jgi:hypothetical protein